MTLIIGYGSLIRGDDGLGWVLAEAVADRLTDTIVVTSTQLTPELAEPISAADHVYFIDAAMGERPGAICCQELHPHALDGAFTHNVTPETLVSAARHFYGRAPEAHLISVVGANFDYGAELSPQLRGLLPDLTDLVQRFIERQA